MAGIDLNIFTLVLWFVVTCLKREYVACTEVPVISPYPRGTVKDLFPLTFTCSYNGTEKIQLLRWQENDVAIVTIKPANCTIFGNWATDSYTHSCLSDNIFTWTISQVKEEQHEDKWSCELFIKNGYIPSDETRVFVQVPVQSVTFFSPQEDCITVNESQETTFKCNTSEERPRSQILWFFNDSSTFLSEAFITPQNNNTRVSTTGLLSHAFKREDDGKRVFCTASNVLGEATRKSNTKTLYVQYSQDGPPIIHSFSNGSIYKMIENTTQILYCSASGGNPLPVLNWNCNTEEEVINQVYGSTVNKSVVWTATRDQVQDCVCTSDHPVSGILSSRLKVEVLYPPSKPSFDVNRVSVATVVVVLGRYAAVGCTSLSNPSPLYGWTSTTFDGSVIGSNFSLMNVEVKDTGNYTCTAKNFMVTSDGRSINGSHSADISIIVQYPPTSPEVWYSKAEVFGVISVILGDVVLVSCESDGNPSPKVTWNVQNNATLQFQAIQLSNEGRYTCTATNTLTPTGGSNETITMSKEIYIDVECLKYHMGNTNFSTDQAHEVSYMQNWPSAEAIDRRNCSIESCCQPYSDDVDCILCPQALDGTGL